MLLIDGLIVVVVVVVAVIAVKSLFWLVISLMNVSIVKRSTCIRYGYRCIRYGYGCDTLRAQQTPLNS